MMRAALLLAAVLGGCPTAPRPAVQPGAAAQPGTPAFDAADWLARARAANGLVFMDSSEESQKEALDAERRLSAELDSATGWMRACDTRWDAETAREVFEPDELGDGPFLRGSYELYAIAPGEAVAAVTCWFGEYEGQDALVHIEGARAVVLRAVVFDVNGNPVGPPSAVFTMPSLRDGSRTFETFAAGRSRMDCGVLTRYRLGAGSETTVLEARARRCNGHPANTLPDSEWPVVFPR